MDMEITPLDRAKINLTKGVPVLGDTPIVLRALDISKWTIFHGLGVCIRTVTNTYGHEICSSSYSKDWSFKQSIDLFGGVATGVNHR